MGIVLSLGAAAAVFGLGRLLWVRKVEPWMRGEEGGDEASATEAVDDAAPEAAGAARADGGARAERWPVRLDEKDRRALFGESGLREPQPCVLSGAAPATAIVTLSGGWRLDKRRLLQVASHVGDLLPHATAGRGDGAHVEAAVGFGSTLWRAAEEATPEEALVKSAPFAHAAAKGAKAKLPASAGDVVVHVKGSNADVVWDFVRLLRDAVPLSLIGGSGFDDVHGFGYRNGHMSPAGFALSPPDDASDDGAASAVAVRAARAANAIGGSYLTTQRWVTDMEKARALAQRDAQPRTPRDPRTPGGGASASAVRVQAAAYSTGLGSARGAAETGLVVASYASSPEAAHAAQLALAEGGVDAEQRGDEGQEVWEVSRCAASNTYYVPSKAQLAALARGVGSPWATEEAEASKEQA